MGSSCSWSGTSGTRSVHAASVTDSDPHMAPQEPSLSPAPGPSSIAAQYRGSLDWPLWSGHFPRQHKSVVTTVFDCFRFMELAKIGRCRASVSPPAPPPTKSSSNAWGAPLSEMTAKPRSKARVSYTYTTRGVSASSPGLIGQTSYQPTFLPCHQSDAESSEASFRSLPVQRAWCFCVCTETRDRARKWRHAWNFMPPGSFGIVL